MLNDPSLFLNQPSSAPVTLEPESLGGSRGKCVGTCPRTASTHVIRTSSTLRLAIAGRCNRILRLLLTGIGRVVCFLFGKLGLIVFITHVGDVHPCMAHLVYGPVSKSYPL